MQARSIVKRFTLLLLLTAGGGSDCGNGPMGMTADEDAGVPVPSDGGSTPDGGGSESLTIRVAGPDQQPLMESEALSLLGAIAANADRVDCERPKDPTIGITCPSIGNKLVTATPKSDLPAFSFLRWESKPNSCSGMTVCQFVGSKSSPKELTARFQRQDRHFRPQWPVYGIRAMGRLRSGGWWAAGTQGQILQQQLIGWKGVGTPAWSDTRTYHALWGGIKNADKPVVWVGGEEKQLLRIQDNTITPYSDPGIETFPHLLGVAGEDPQAPDQNVWVVGTQGYMALCGAGPSQTVGCTGAAMDKPINRLTLNAVWAAPFGGQGIAVAVGEGGVVVVGTREGTQAPKARILVPGSDARCQPGQTLRAVVGVPIEPGTKVGIWAAGDGGLVYSFTLKPSPMGVWELESGSVACEVQGGPATSWNALARNGTTPASNIWAAGSDGSMRVINKQFATNGPKAPGALWAVAADDTSTLVGGDGGIYLFDPSPPTGK